MATRSIRYIDMSTIVKYLRGNLAKNGLIGSTWSNIIRRANVKGAALIVFEVPEDDWLEVAGKVDEFLQKEVLK